jgi:hypothetical protein
MAPPDRCWFGNFVGMPQSGLVMGEAKRPGGLGNSPRIAMTGAGLKACDCMGLVPLLQNRELTAVTAEMAILRARSGATQRFYRRHPALGRPLWDLVR